MISGWFLLIFELSSASRIGLKKSGAKILNINEVTAMSKKRPFFFEYLPGLGELTLSELYKKNRVLVYLKRYIQYSSIRI